MTKSAFLAELSGRLTALPQSEIEKSVAYYSEIIDDRIEEGLDEETMDIAVLAFRGADTRIVGGSSLAVYPAAGLLRYFRGETLVVINKQPTPADAMANLLIHAPIGRTLDPDAPVEV